MNRAASVPILKGPGRVPRPTYLSWGVGGPWPQPSANQAGPPRDKHSMAMNQYGHSMTTDKALLVPAITNPCNRKLFFPQSGDPELPWEGEWQDYEEVELPPDRGQRELEV